MIMCKSGEQSEENYRKNIIGIHPMLNCITLTWPSENRKQVNKRRSCLVNIFRYDQLLGDLALFLRNIKEFSGVKNVGLGQLKMTCLKQ